MSTLWAPLTGLGGFGRLSWTKRERLSMGQVDGEIARREPKFVRAWKTQNEGPGVQDRNADSLDLLRKRVRLEHRRMRRSEEQACTYQ